MRLTVQEKRKATRIKAARYQYQKTSKKKNGTILDEFIAFTVYDPCYVSYLLKSQGRRVWANNRVIAIGDINKRHKINHFSLFVGVGRTE